MAISTQRIRLHVCIATHGFELRAWAGLGFRNLGFRVCTGFRVRVTA